MRLFTLALAGVLIGVAATPALADTLIDARPTPYPAPLPILLADGHKGPADKAEAPRPSRPGPWYAEASFGYLNPDDFTTIMFQPYKTEMEDESHAIVGLGREIYDFGYGFTAELGFIFGHRIDEGGVEFGLPLAVTFDRFPWRETVPTRLRLAVGPSFVTKITPTERRKADNGEGSRLLNMFNPEIEVGVPGAPEWNGFLRLHHRSGIFGLINGVSGGSTYVMAGVRHRFSLD